MDDISVLVCDDSALMRNVISRVIDGTPGMHVVDKAMNGQILIDKVAACNPDVIILDIEMPVMTGIDYLKYRKQSGGDVPVIILSSIAEKGAAVTVEALELGASDFITKPNGSVSMDINAVADRSVELSWGESKGADSYNVYRQKITDDSFEKIASTTATTYADTNIIDNPSAYRYYVTAAKSSSESAVSVERFVHTYGINPAYFDPANDGGVRNYHVPLSFKVGDVYEEGKYLTDYFSYNGDFDVTITEGSDVISIDDNVITAKKAGTAKVVIHVTDAVRNIIENTLEDDLVDLLTSRDVILEITVE